jgi:hypothetical protein
MIRDATDADMPAIRDLYNTLIDTTTIAWTDAHQSLRDRRAWFRSGAQRPGGPATSRPTEGVSSSGRLPVHGDVPGPDLEFEHARPHGWIGGGERLDLVAVHLGRGDHHAARFTGEEGAAHLESPLLVQRRVVAHMIPHTRLLAEVDPVDPAPAGSVEDDVSK